MENNDDDDDDNFDVEIESEIERRIKQSQENIEKLTRASLSMLPRSAAVADGPSSRLSVDKSPQSATIDLTSHAAVTSQAGVTPRRDSKSDDHSIQLIPGVKTLDRQAFEPMAVFFASVARDRLRATEEVLF